ncbi:HEAT repeat domain-containing protein [bacterium]|nr:HEAT repeat domain-containing protein [bacterium]
MATQKSLSFAFAGFLSIVTLFTFSSDVRSDDADAAAKELSEFRVADGFKIELFASDPEIAKPIQMNFDSQGRLWLVTSESYPQLAPGSEPIDKVFIIEDADRDGKADKSRMFASGLRIPTGIEIAPKGIYVGNATDLIMLRDLNGDGKADQQDIVLTAFGTEDTHHLIHTFRWSPWGNLFFAQAVYIHSHVETPFGIRRLNGGGFWEYNPETHRLEIFVTGMTNSWGIAFDEFGQAFGVDNDQYSVNYFPPGAHMIRTPNESHLFPSLVSGKPKYCGAEFVASSHFPDDWQGNFLTCDFRAHRICRYKITDDGAGYKAEELPELLSTSNVAFRPVDVKFGLDGALYVCDWYNPIINHGEVDFRDPRRDRTHGRIWRISRSDRAPMITPHFEKLGVPELIEQQKSKDGSIAHFSRRELAARDVDETIKALDQWVAKENDEAIVLRALWTYETVGKLNVPLLRKLLEAKDYHVRAAAVRSITRHRDEINDAVTLIRARIQDVHPRVRVEAVRALVGEQNPEAMSWALASLDKGNDPVLSYELALNARETARRWIPELEAGRLHGQSPDRWISLLLAVDSPAAVASLQKLIAEHEIKPSEEETILGFIGRHGNPAQLSWLMERAQKGTTSPAVRARIIASLAEAFRLRQTRPEGNLTDVASKWLDSKEPAVKQGSIQLVGVWKLEPLRGKLAEIIRSDANTNERQAAVDSLRQLGGAESLNLLTDLYKTSVDVPTKQAALVAIVALDPNKAAGQVVPVLESSSDTAIAGDSIQAFLSNQQGPDILAVALAEKSIKPEVAQEGLRRINASGQIFTRLSAALRKAGNLPMTERNISPEQIRRVAEQVKQSGDPHRGKLVYERKELACATCHVIRGKGGKVGPDLTSIGASAPVDYLVESLLLPSSKVKENYHSLTVITDEGKVVTGIPEKQSESEITLRLADDKTVSIAKSSIDETKQGGSLMPTDVVDALPSGDLLDLVRYLSELGKPGPFGVNAELAAKKWRLLGPVAAKERDPLTQQILANSAGIKWRESLTTNDAWVYVRELSLSPDLPVFFATTDINVTKPGKIHLTLQPGEKAEYWLDGKPLKAEKTGPEESVADVELPAGKHSLLIRVDLTKTPAFVKLRAYGIGEGISFELEKP